MTHVTVQTSVAMLCTHTTAFLQIATELYMVTLPLKLKASLKSISESRCFVKELEANIIDTNTTVSQ